MKKRIWITSLAVLIMLISGCKLIDDSDTTTVEPVEENKTVTVRGMVINHVTSESISNATVTILNLSTSPSTITENSGTYSFELTVDAATSISIVAFKEDYTPDTVTVNIAPGKTVEVSDLKLKKSDGTIIISDDAASIYLLSQSVEKLGIKESGDVETAIATFQVIDSSGVPIDASKVVQVEFLILEGPGGGEFLYPSSVKTDEKGQATVAITTGTVAGVLQIQAQIVSSTKTIRSKPVFFTIYAGFPVQENFAVGCPKLNYPYWGIMNKEIEFTALLGDKYSNPVRTNTAVYFNTTSGVIGDFIYTDILGRAVSTLATFGFPDHPVYGPGFFEVTASTINETSETIHTSTRRLLSSNPIISGVSPTSFAISNGGSQSFSFTVKDFNGNPVSSDHTISFDVDGALSVSPGSIKIPDALSGGPGITSFTFTIGDSDPKEIDLATASVTIVVSGPFGTFSYAIEGTTE